MRHAVIIAGGSGTRLWPISRRNRPKQLMRLFGGASLLQLAVRRVADIFEPRNTWVITSAAYIDLVARELPEIPRENLIGEPMGRDTANAVGLGAYLIARRDPDATMAVFTADHMISPPDRFRAAIEAGLDAAERFPDALVTFGVTPDSPQTGYGYVRRGERRGPTTFSVAEFKEKPTLEKAREFLASGEYLWNSGMFAWRVSAIRDEIRRCLPNNAAILDELTADWPAVTTRADFAARFESLPRISIDFGVMEKASHVLVVEMPCQWLDLGSWTAIGQTARPDATRNAVVAPRALLIQSSGNVVVSETDHLIVGLGVEDLVIVHSPDATLVCRKDNVQLIKDLVDPRRSAYGELFE